MKQLMKECIVVGSGGMIGAVGRYLMTLLVNSLSKGHPFPFSTLVVNFIGCFAFGIMSGLVEHSKIITPTMKLFIMVGIIAAFTTFSTFSHDIFVMIRNNQIMLAFFNLFIKVSFGVIAVWLGFIVTKSLFIKGA
jgi:CrcB protein